MSKIKIHRTNFVTEIDDAIFNDVSNKNPSKEIQISFKTNWNLKKLKDNEGVIWGDGETYVFIAIDKK